MTTATHSLTNGLQNFIFTVTDFDASLVVINEWGQETHKEVMSVQELRRQWAAAIKHCCHRGWTNPRRSQPSAFDADDNRWEAQMAFQEN